MVFKEKTNVKLKVYAVIVTLILLGIAGYVGYNYIDNKSYTTGFYRGQYSVAAEQSRTGNIAYIENNTIMLVAINDLCKSRPS